MERDMVCFLHLIKCPYGDFNAISNPRKFGYMYSDYISKFELEFKAYFFNYHISYTDPTFKLDFIIKLKKYAQNIYKK